MPGLGLTINRTGPGTGPILPVALHSNGVGGASHRYVPERLNLATGAPITKVPDLIGTYDLTQVSAGTYSPIVGETGGQRYLKWGYAGPTKYLQNIAADLGTVFTFATLIRMSVAASPLALYADGYKARVYGNGQWGLEGGNGAGAAGVLGYMARPSAFALLTAVCDGANSKLQIDGTTLTPTTATIVGADPTNNDVLRWGYPVASSTLVSPEEHAIVEQNIWPFALTADQRAAHYAAMRAKWTALLA